MRKNTTLSAVGAVALACSVFAISIAIGATATGAATTKIDLSMTGNAVAGYTNASSGNELPVTFTMRNNSGSTTAGDVSFLFTVTHATAADSSDWICPLTSNHHLINPDTPACEPGGLAHGKSTSAAIMVTPTISSGTVAVKACASLLDGHTDPVPSNNCKTVSIRIG